MTPIGGAIIDADRDMDLDLVDDSDDERSQAAEAEVAGLNGERAKKPTKKRITKAQKSLKKAIAK